MKWNALTVCLVNSDNYVRCNDNAEKYVLDYCVIVSSVGSVCLESITRRRMARNELRKCLRNGNFNLIISDLKNHFRKKIKNLLGSNYLIEDRNEY